MRPLCRVGWVILLVLSGCARAAPAPEPVVLSYPYEADGADLFEGYRRLAERVSGAYTRVLVYGENEDEGAPALGIVSGASGAIIDPRGYVITAAHVARDTRFRVSVTTMDGEVHDGSIIHVAPRRELALLKIEAFAGMAVASIAGPRSLRGGERVLAIGTPGNRKGVVSLGRVSDPKRAARIEFGEFGFDDAIELDMEVEPGHSGGPVFDTRGELIGIIAGFGLGDTRRVPYVSTRIAYAVPAGHIAAYLADVLAPQIPPGSLLAPNAGSASFNGL